MTTPLTPINMDAYYERLTSPDTPPPCVWADVRDRE